MWGSRRLPSGTTYLRSRRLGGLHEDRREVPPGCYTLRRQGAAQLGHVQLIRLVPLLRWQEALVSHHGSPPPHWEAGGDPHRGAGVI